MKHVLLFLAIIVSFSALSTPTYAKDKWKDDSKGLSNDLDALNHHYDMVKDRVKNLGNGDRRLWDGLHDIRRNIDSINGQASSGRYDGRDLRDQIRHANDDLDRLQAQMESNNKHRGGYRPY
ncbi:MAG: hypothetical protein P4L99_13185 [Chthoniobacter sp.]|nr:hypothetical protein [Chthoniobacter sp.]